MNFLNQFLMFAQAADPTTKEAWVSSYAVVILCVGLALFVICRPSRRDKRVQK